MFSVTNFSLVNFKVEKMPLGLTEFGDTSKRSTKGIRSHFEVVWNPKTKLYKAIVNQLLFSDNGKDLWIAFDYRL
jgi:hypothetical protein